MRVDEYIFSDDEYLSCLAAPQRSDFYTGLPDLPIFEFEEVSLNASCSSPLTSSRYSVEFNSMFEDVPHRSIFDDICLIPPIDPSTGSMDHPGSESTDIFLPSSYPLFGVNLDMTKYMKKLSNEESILSNESEELHKCLTEDTDCLGDEKFDIMKYIKTESSEESESPNNSPSSPCKSEKFVDESPLDEKNFDILNYVSKESAGEPVAPKINVRRTTTGKKIDIKKQCYVIGSSSNNESDAPDTSNSSDDSDESDASVPSEDDVESQSLASEQPISEEVVYVKSEPPESEDDHVDVETVSQDGSPTVLEASDLYSLLDQFEATPDIHPTALTDWSNRENFLDVQLGKPKPIAGRLCFPDAKWRTVLTEREIKTELEPQMPVLRKEVPCPEDPEKTCRSSVSSKPPGLQPQIHQIELRVSQATTSKQIIESLPPEVVKRLKELGKRKPVPLISPISNKKKCGNNRPVESSSPVTSSNIKKMVSLEALRLDHDYCNVQSPYSKEPKIDSGFGSAEEDERTILRNQPTVKNADGKLMVSLLKVNTIKPNPESDARPKPKRKLNLAEYKKRKPIVVVQSKEKADHCGNAQNEIKEEEDERTKSEKYQEKIKKLAAGVLNIKNTKSNLTGSSKTDVASETTALAQPPPATVNPSRAAAPPAQIPQPAAEVTVVEKLPATPVTALPQFSAVGVSTSKVTSAELPAIAVKPQSLAAEAGPKRQPCYLIRKEIIDISVNTEESSFCNIPVIEEIKPLLQNVKISDNSLIKCCMESVTKAKSKHIKSAMQSVTGRTLGKPWENRRTVHVPKVKPKMCDSAVQTVETSVAAGRKRRRRRSRSSSSDSSSSSKPYHRKRRCRTSRYTSSESCSTCSSSRSRSSSPSRPTSAYPRQRSQCNDDNEVEERRVIYVGRISSSTTREALRRRFRSFGPITKVSVHFRERGDNYGFVTFLNKQDAYAALERGNDDPLKPKYDLSFGGRRAFCKTQYSDLDKLAAQEAEEMRCPVKRMNAVPFNILLEDLKAALSKKA